MPPKPGSHSGGKDDKSNGKQRNQGSGNNKSADSAQDESPRVEAAERKRKKDAQPKDDEDDEPIFKKPKFDYSDPKWMSKHRKEKAALRAKMGLGPIVKTKDKKDNESPNVAVSSSKPDPHQYEGTRNHGHFIQQENKQETGGAIGSAYHLVSGAVGVRSLQELKISIETTKSLLGQFIKPAIALLEEAERLVRAGKGNEALLHPAHLRSTLELGLPDREDSLARSSAYTSDVLH
ncbi:uncharacterized protein RAG0_15408 [Rhynchosporium agropyri]|uniref:Uncharacterized protein n=1 Tax=Rhynchosporium agropyri TaxID=914238 RepID=A0A1E1LL06_9HELO|nr:uncharacterized protein RAG0_15408 [Rhynchosporium agropyri]